MPNNDTSNNQQIKLCTHLNNFINHSHSNYLNKSFKGISIKSLNITNCHQATLEVEGKSKGENDLARSIRGLLLLVFNSNHITRIFNAKYNTITYNIALKNSITLKEITEEASKLNELIHFIENEKYSGSDAVLQAIYNEKYELSIRIRSQSNRWLNMLTISKDKIFNDPFTYSLFSKKEEGKEEEIYNNKSSFDNTELRQVESSTIKGGLWHHLEAWAKKNIPFPQKTTNKQQGIILQAQELNQGAGLEAGIKDNQHNTSNTPEELHAEYVTIDIKEKDIPPPSPTQKLPYKDIRSNLQGSTSRHTTRSGQKVTVSPDKQKEGSKQKSLLCKLSTKSFISKQGVQKSSLNQAKTLEANQFDTLNTPRENLAQSSPSDADELNTILSHSLSHGAINPIEQKVNVFPVKWKSSGKQMDWICILRTTSFIFFLSTCIFITPLCSSNDRVECIISLSIVIACFLLSLTTAYCSIIKNDNLIEDAKVENNNRRLQQV